MTTTEVYRMSVIRHWIALRPNRDARFKHSPAVYTTDAEEAERFGANGWEILGPLTDDRGGPYPALKTTWARRPMRST